MNRVVWASRLLVVGCAALLFSWSVIAPTDKIEADHTAKALTAQAATAPEVLDASVKAPTQAQVQTPATTAPVSKPQPAAATSRPAVKAPVLVPKPPVAQPIGPVPIQAVSASIHVLSYCNPTQLGYNLEFSNYSNIGSTLRLYWEHEIISGPTSLYPASPQIINDYPLGAGMVRIFDNYPAYQQSLTVYPNFSYRIRLHITSPNDVVSNWIEVPIASDPRCQ